MKKFFPLLFAVVAFGLGVTFTTAFATPQNNMQTEEAKHPRMAKALTAMQDAVDEMTAAPDDFGGHKAAAIADTKAAIKSMKEALHYRAKQDNK